MQCAVHISKEAHWTSSRVLHIAHLQGYLEVVLKAVLQPESYAGVLMRHCATCQAGKKHVQLKMRPRVMLINSHCEC